MCVPCVVAVPMMFPPLGVLLAVLCFPLFMLFLVFCAIVAKSEEQEMEGRRVTATAPFRFLSGRLMTGDEERRTAATRGQRIVLRWTSLVLLVSAVVEPVVVASLFPYAVTALAGVLACRTYRPGVLPAASFPASVKIEQIDASPDLFLDEVLDVKPLKVHEYSWGDPR